MTCVDAQVTADPQHPTHYCRSQDSSLPLCVSPGPQHGSTAVSLSSRISIHRHLPTSPSIFHMASCIHLARMLHLQPALNTRLVAGAARHLLCHAQLRSQHGAHLPGIPHQGFTHARPTKRIMYKICAHVHPSMLAHTLPGALPPMASAFHPVILSTGVAGTRALIMPIFHLVDLSSRSDQSTTRVLSVLPYWVLSIEPCSLASISFHQLAITRGSTR